MDISIIIPAYNEEKRIGTTIDNINNYLKGKDYEIIVVDDGSKDNTSSIVKYKKRVKIIKNKKNRGKGYSVKKGILKAKGDLILFTDSDLATPIKEFNKLKREIEKGYDIAIASRNMKNSIVKTKQPIYRRLLGRLFPLIVKMMILSDFNDTQCGFKLYTHYAAKKIVKQQKINGFSFDVEQLYIAKKLNLKISEVPVIWNDKDGSKLSPIRDSIKMLFELVKIRLEHHREFK